MGNEDRLLTDKDVQAIVEELTKLGGVTHQCRFTNEEAQLLHQFRRDVDRDSLIVLGWLGKTIRSAGMWIARFILISMVAAGMALAGLAVKYGWVKIPQP